jgi:hypothetical protein
MEFMPSLSQGFTATRTPLVPDGSLGTEQLLTLAAR